MRGGGQGIGRAAPDVAAAVTVEIHGVGVVGGRNELGLAHRPGPRAEHFLRSDIALLQDLQRRDQLCMSKCGATAFVGQGRQRVDHRFGALELTEVAFHAPYRHQCLAIHAITLFDVLQDVGVLTDQRLPLAHSQRRQGAIEVFPYWTRELRLAAVGFDHTGIEADIGKRAVEQIGADPGCQGILAETRLPFGKGLGWLKIKWVSGRHYRRDDCRGCCDRGGLKGLRIGGGRFFRAGDKQNEAGGSDQLANGPTTGKTEGHAQFQGIRIRCRP